MFSPSLVKLRSMRCQDCGQQFTRWEAFKIHQRKHVAEGVEFEKRDIKRPLQALNQNKTKKKRCEDMDDGKDEEGDDGEEEDEEEFFDSACQIKPSEIVMVRPRVAMLSQEEKPVYGSSNQVYSCRICGKTYYYQESFKNHQKTHSPSEVRNDNQCPDCGKVFRSAIGLSTHMKVHKPSVEPEKPVELHCDQCNKSFNSTHTWLEHNEIHQNKEFWCLSCATGFEDAKSLDMHLLYHNTKHHRCDICFKSFRVPAELRHHYNTHRGFKPYKCNFCYKRFPKLDNLITHRKRHLGSYKEGASDQLGQRSSQTGHRKVSVMKTLIISGKGAVKAPEEFSWQASCETEERLGPGLNDEHDEEGICNNGSIENSESDNNKKGSDRGSSANSNSVEEEEELVVVEKTSYGMVQRDNRPVQVKEEEDDDVVFTGQLSQPTRQQQQGQWKCFECGTSFFQEPELHLHYMKHASGEL